jgi:hypothetical protein
MLVRRGNYPKTWLNMAQLFYIQMEFRIRIEDCHPEQPVGTWGFFSAFYEEFMGYKPPIHVVGLSLNPQLR